MNKDDTQKLNKEVGERLKHFRRKSGLKQSDIARETGCTPTYISMIETGKCKIPVFIVMSYSKILELSPNVLLGYADNTEKIMALTEELKENVGEYIEKIQSLIGKKPESPGQANKPFP